MMSKKVVVLSGAGISAESGIKTFRDHDGLWENYRIEDVATYDAWLKNPELVLDFYNKRRMQLAEVEPNAAHYALVRLEEKYQVQIITQNVDDLHERAGSANVLHLHGELTKARSSDLSGQVFDIGYGKLKMGDLCNNGSQLRPHIVWFGEEVPLIEDAAVMTSEADILLVIGTSLLVYPAAGLLHYAPAHCRIFLIDPGNLNVQGIRNLTFIQKMAGKGVPEIVSQLLAELEIN
ncbi:MAG: NAD-dependent deacylase [Lentimicrobiaceae bacterium]|nr:NAD-dependent deacylase [Lentimicrobiaceae bacterium]MCO5265177.1 NAD-dependent deacylase [Lentimicrobium sp.]HPG32722.1 NAD-dependent deacylase [Lentimicrobium sp.]